MKTATKTKTTFIWIGAILLTLFAGYEVNANIRKLLVKSELTVLDTGGLMVSLGAVLLFLIGAVLCWRWLFRNSNRTAAIIVLVVLVTFLACFSGLTVIQYGTAALRDKSFDHYLQGVVYYYKGDHDRAISDFTKSIEINPKFVMAYNNRGWAHLKKGEHDLAISDFNKSIEIKPRYAKAYYNRGIAYNAKGQYDRSISDYTKAVEINPRYAMAYNNLAWLLATCPDAKYRDGRKAIENATRACELSQWANPDYLDTLAGAYAEVGEFEQATKWQAKAIELAALDYDKAAMQSRLKLYKTGKPYREEKDELK